MFQNGESYIVFEDGTVYNRKWMEFILNEAIVKKIINYAETFNSLTLSDLEVALLCAVQLTSYNSGKCNINVCNFDNKYIQNKAFHYLVLEFKSYI